MKTLLSPCYVYFWDEVLVALGWCYVLIIVSNEGAVIKRLTISRKPPSHQEFEPFFLVRRSEGFASLILPLLSLFCRCFSSRLLVLLLFFWERRFAPSFSGDWGFIYYLDAAFDSHLASRRTHTGLLIADHRFWPTANATLPPLLLYFYVAGSMLTLSDVSDDPKNLLLRKRRLSEEYLFNQRNGRLGDAS